MYLCQLVKDFPCFQRCFLGCKIERDETTFREQQFKKFMKLIIFYFGFVPDFCSVRKKEVQKEFWAAV
jgi:hypothetical protein